MDGGGGIRCLALPTRRTDCSGAQGVWGEMQPKLHPAAPMGGVRQKAPGLLFSASKPKDPGLNGACASRCAWLEQRDEWRGAQPQLLPSAPFHRAHDAIKGTSCAQRDSRSMRCVSSSLQQTVGEYMPTGTIIGMVNRRKGELHARTILPMQ